MDYKMLIVMGFVGMRLITLSNFSYGDPVTLIAESIKAYKAYRDYQNVINPKDNSVQNAAINSSPVMLSLDEQRERYLRIKRINECHKDYDTIILGKAFTSSKCKQLEDNLYEPIDYKAEEK